MNGSNTSTGPMTTKVMTHAAIRVHNSHGVVIVKEMPSFRSASTLVFSCDSVSSIRSRGTRTHNNNTSAHAWKAATMNAPVAGMNAPTTIPATAGPAPCWRVGRSAPSIPFAARSSSAGNTFGNSAV
ncbi:hypothetical protein IM25_04835 [Rhodococcus sp. p52]|uniref:Uncharacterized protein n=1 Tax=Rhodococcus pyridinivorans SB3094 TaxID=1435356 RepID=V9XP78_9NOCA|nr:hypothetical protein Y013_13490 [Rhodococcus pyridinivorans SB3094]AOD21039.1 hypothetical protein IM25_04835 [Rhodococcus sp. p52]KHJ73983.1 hypothetical protein QR64_03990 [Rhodococcus sp. Chr-9]